jgi:hypothetical protein
MLNQAILLSGYGDELVVVKNIFIRLNFHRRKTWEECVNTVPRRRQSIS